MEENYDKHSARKWKRSLSSILPGFANRMMAPASATNNTNPNDAASHHLPVFTISGCDVATGLETGTKGSTVAKATGPKSPAALSTFSFDGPVCRICHDVKDNSGGKKLISPCGCTGSAEFVHKQCLQKWTKFKGSSTCEICHQSYQTKYVKYKMTSSEENTVASAVTILLLLLGVLAVGVYLLAEYLIKVNRDPRNRGSNEIWVSTSLIIIGLLGTAIFLPWFVTFCAKAGRTPRSSMMSPGSNNSNTESSSADSPSSLESSLTDLSSTSSTADVESGHVAYGSERAHQFAYDNELAYDTDELPYEIDNELNGKEQSFAASGYHSISETNCNTASSSMSVSVSTSVPCSSSSTETEIQKTFIDCDVQVDLPMDNSSRA